MLFGLRLNIQWGPRQCSNSTRWPLAPNSSKRCYFFIKIIIYAGHPEFHREPWASLQYSFGLSGTN